MPIIISGSSAQIQNLFIIWHKMEFVCRITNWKKSFKFFLPLFSSINSIACAQNFVDELFDTCPSRQVIQTQFEWQAIYSQEKEYEENMRGDVSLLCHAENSA
ncbi:hypothetical protein ACO0LF_07235 [Undibacterium sp. Di27W]|uniref:hypothetical protein n=1 Tax=Undibacterium sp. Di27W TaxID=3413036 RepID=UPI003BEF8201